MIITRDVDVSYEKNADSRHFFFPDLVTAHGLADPFASAIEYEGVESMTVDATAALLIDLDTDQVLYEQAAVNSVIPPVSPKL